MATRTPTVERQGEGFGARFVTWTGLLNGDDGTPVELPEHAHRTIQIAGTFGAGGTIVFEGSNDGTNYVTLNDTGGTAISKTSAALVSVREVPRYIRPRVTAGDGTTALVVTMLARRA